MVRNWETKVVRLGDMVPQEHNARVIDPAAIKGLQASIERFGLVELIVWNKRTKHIVGGHQRYDILLRSGVVEVPVVVVDMSPEEELAASLTLNNPAIEGEFDEPVMELMGQVEQAAPGLFKAVRIDELRASLERNTGSSGGSEQEWDTECPCCKHRWKVDAKDIVVVSGKGRG